MGRFSEISYVEGIIPSAPVAPTRHGSPQTSYDAAASVKVRKSQQLVLDILRVYGPCSDSEIHEWAVGKLSPSGARTRRSELCAKSLVEDSGKRVTLSSGRKSIIWKLV